MFFWFKKQDDAHRFMDAATAQYALQWRHLGDAVNPADGSMQLLFGAQSACSYLGALEDWKPLGDSTIDQLRLLAQDHGAEIVGG